jgi:hypothetical protein
VAALAVKVSVAGVAELALPWKGEIVSHEAFDDVANVIAALLVVASVTLAEVWAPAVTDMALVPVSDVGLGTSVETTPPPVVKVTENVTGGTPDGEVATSFTVAVCVPVFGV